MDNKKPLSHSNIDINEIYYEISGLCNAKCRYCPTGSGITSDCPSRFIPVEEFSLGLNRLYNLGLLKKNTFLFLFNWGDPMLHPNLVGILDVLNKHQQSFSLSTNGSIIPKNMNSTSLQNLNYMRISLHGFSQESYNKINKLDFQQVLRNIQIINEFIPPNSLEIAFFAYRFNVKEIEIARDFFQDLEINFTVYLPHTMDIEDSIRYLTENLPSHQKETMNADMFTDHINPLMKNYEKEHSCPYLQKHLVIDEYNRILICCAIPKNNTDYEVGSLLDMTLEDIISIKTHGKPICERCLSAGVPYWYAQNNEGLNLFFKKNNNQE